MLLIATRVALVILAGIYAMRSSSVLFQPRPFEPLMVAAVFAFILAVVLFYVPPVVKGWWFYSAIALCLVGAAANAMLYFAPDELHNNPTDLVFSMVSMIGWAMVAIGLAARVLGLGSSAA
jgi:hypothetical protein